MNELQKVVNAVLVQQKLLLAPSTYDVRRRYLEQLSDHAEKTGFTEPCQELYDSYVSRADTPDLRFQLFHAVRLVDKEAGTRAFMPEGTLYNEPEIPSSYEAEYAFRTVEFPIIDGSIDIGHLIRRAENEMEYLIGRKACTGQASNILLMEVFFYGTVFNLSNNYRRNLRKLQKFLLSSHIQGKGMGKV